MSDDQAAAVAVRARVTGEVQGVGYRWSTAQQAERLGVTGWVRNEPDGSVVLHAEGDRAAVDALVDWCRSGPAHARVDAVTTDAVRPEGAASFRVQP